MATIAEKSRTKEIIDRLQSIIDNASTVPLAPGKISVFKDELQSLLAELAAQIEIELKTYHEVNDRKGKIISEAKKEAERIIYQAEHSASRMRVSKRTTDVAPLDYDALSDEERGALDNANEIYGASLIYTDEMLAEVTDMINDAYHNIRSDYEIILQVLEEKLNVINNNRAELMDGLREMDEADHSQQILEIGQLLSSELYMSRMKAKMNSDEYDDGSIQLSLDLQEEQEEKTRQAEEKAQRAEIALAEMTAQRDALAAKVEKMEKYGNKAKVQTTGTAVVKEAAALGGAMAEAAITAETASLGANAKPSVKAEAKSPDFVKMMDDSSSQNTSPDTKSKEKTSQSNINSEQSVEEDVEYEIVYVTEDELEEGEEYEIEYVDEDELEEDVEYEIEYVDEEDLEEGEEYEIEYVDEEETEEPQQIALEKASKDKSADEKIVEQQKKNETGIDEKRDKKTEEDIPKSREVEEAIKALEEMEGKKTPVIPRFKKSESVASVPSEKVAKMATAITTDKKYSGLISRAVKQREKAEEEAAVSVEPADSIKQDKEQEKEQDKDIKTDANGKEYVQATMQFDEDFEIMEF